jgi:hypothetical protein
VGLKVTQTALLDFIQVRGAAAICSPEPGADTAHLHGIEHAPLGCIGAQHHPAVSSCGPDCHGSVYFDSDLGLCSSVVIMLPVACSAAPTQYFAMSRSNDLCAAVFASRAQRRQSPAYSLNSLFDIIMRQCRRASMCEQRSPTNRGAGRELKLRDFNIVPWLK